MILDVKTYPDRVLSQKAKRVGEIDDEIKKLIDDMIETLYAKKGAGLAANQVGVARQIMVVDAGEGARVFINPKILNKKGQVILAEGCLSVPGLELEIKRPVKIEVEFLDQRGRRQTLNAEQLLARVICHEMDHLNGKTMLDRLSLIKRFVLKHRLKKAAKKN